MVGGWGGDSRARAESTTRNGNNPGPFGGDNQSWTFQDQAEER